MKVIQRIRKSISCPRLLEELEYANVCQDQPCSMHWLSWHTKHTYPQKGTLLIRALALTTSSSRARFTPSIPGMNITRRQILPITLKALKIWTLAEMDSPQNR